MCTVLIVVGCTSALKKADQLAVHLGLKPVELSGTRFVHHSYVKLHPRETQLVVFIEGDGSPWVENGRLEAADPTPRNPLALRLAARTPGSVLYLGRPCYYGHANDAGCSVKIWTSERYSDAVVTSLVAVLSEFIREHGVSSVVMVGHSGGGTLAVLMAARLPAVTAVLTIAGNLDVHAWTRLHRYLPLDESLNPADLPRLPAHVTERHLTEAHDERVPAVAAKRYLDRLRPDAVISFPEFDHVCCWERDWARIWADFMSQMQESGY